jgi:ATP-dependent DNA helicase RecG
LIVELISADPSITRELLAEKTGVSSDAVKQHLANLKKDGLIKRVGGRKDGKWEMVL